MLYKHRQQKMSSSPAISQTSVVRLRTGGKLEGSEHCLCLVCAYIGLSYGMHRPSRVKHSSPCLLSRLGCGWILSKPRLSHWPRQWHIVSKAYVLADEDPPRGNHVYSTPRAAAWTALFTGTCGGDLCSSHLPLRKIVPNDWTGTQSGNLISWGAEWMSCRFWGHLACHLTHYELFV